jgi:hypothetical protein
MVGGKKIEGRKVGVYMSNLVFQMQKGGLDYGCTRLSIYQNEVRKWAVEEGRFSGTSRTSSNSPG